MIDKTNAVDTVECSECHAFVAKSPEGALTAGYYEISGESGWAEFAKPGQEILCDKCMWATEGYQRVYGRVGLWQ
jgi:hypothetical protein